MVIVVFPRSLDAWAVEVLQDIVDPDLRIQLRLPKTNESSEDVRAGAMLLSVPIVGSLENESEEIEVK
jgi:hypothetical protein